ncbi:MAG: hypothetical protein ACR2QC_07335 [Gammaproteobacteria bacterium]
MIPPPRRPTPSKAGTSTAAKRRGIVRLYAFCDSLRLLARRFLPSQEWDGGWNGMGGAGMGREMQEWDFCVGEGVERFRLSPEWDGGVGGNCGGGRTSAGRRRGEKNMQILPVCANIGVVRRKV